MYWCVEANVSNPIARHSMPSTSTDSHVYATWHLVSRKWGNIIILYIFFRSQPNAGRHACVCLFCIRMCVRVCVRRSCDIFSMNWFCRSLTRMQRDRSHMSNAKYMRICSSKARTKYTTAENLIFKSCSAKLIIWIKISRLRIRKCHRDRLKYETNMNFFPRQILICYTCPFKKWISNNGMRKWTSFQVGIFTLYLAELVTWTLAPSGRKPFIDQSF